ncbi:MAG: heparinase II/III family protein [Pseudomonadota bacterium]
MARLGQLIWQRTLTAPASRVLFAPETLLESDSAKAADVYAGVFTLAGITVDAAGQSPFSLPPPSKAFARELHGFSWLVHLEANPTALSASNARALIDEWLGSKSANGRDATAPDVTAERMMAFLVQSPLLLGGADDLFRQRYFRTLTRHMRRVERYLVRMPPSLVRAEAAAALAIAGTVVADQTGVQRWALAVLGGSLAEQVLPDGGHVSRSPEALLRLLAALLPLREALVRRQQPVPPALSGAIDRMHPMVRFFTHSDGGLCGFHSTSPQPSRLLDAIALYDEVEGSPSGQARYTGFQRLEAGSAVALFDTGGAPPPAFGTLACASALAFEFSHGSQRIVGSCGPLGLAQPSWARAARATAAHSTLALKDRSSARVLAFWPLRRLIGPVLYRAPQAVVAREDISVEASHDGFLAEFGVIHHRRLTLGEDGLYLGGEDWLTGTDRLTAAPFAVRFHVGIGIRVRLDKKKRRAMLLLPDGAIWLFGVEEGPQLRLEESVMLAPERRLRRTAQLVIAGNTLTDPTIRWHIARHGDPLAEPLNEPPNERIGA